jgi:hypothetical protein
MPTCPIVIQPPSAGLVLTAAAGFSEIYPTASADFSEIYKTKQPHVIYFSSQI